ncbi:MAG: ABC transporter ATP-binding protein [Deltaproteobacteria bacterium]|nr:ABC transporter ATP-binding protein [Deltaproteobacteria bacterium]MBW2419146.1 ABC transporter ATP-binding protein [Deltaproteobacteria bacterium]
MIRLEGIWKTYTMGDQQLHALQDVEEVIESGEHVAIMGPSGSGKSTLLNIIGCLDKPSRGTYELDGREVAALEPDDLSRVRLHEIGFVFQSFHLVPRLDALANVALPMTFAGITRGERTELARAALEAVGLADWAHHRPGELSGGQKQRVAIARATVMHPSLLLADEPTGNLDSNSGSQVLELLQHLNREGITLITVTHDPNVARLADRVLVLRDGAIVRRVPGHDVRDLGSLFAEKDSTG